MNLAEHPAEDGKAIAAMTTRGLKEEHMEQVAEWMLQGIKHRDDPKKVAALRHEVVSFALQYPLPSDI